MVGVLHYYLLINRMSQPIPIKGAHARVPINLSRGYFNGPVNTRPEWIKRYQELADKVGESEARLIYGSVLNWQTAERLAGRSGNTRAPTRKRKQRRSQRKRKTKRQVE